MTQYLIEESVYFCYAGSQIVFLDLKRNKYSAIDREQATALDGIVLGWNAPKLSTETTEDTMVNDQTRERVKEELLKLGILTDSETTGKSAAPTRNNKPTVDLFPEYTLHTPSIRPRHVVSFVKAFFYATIMLRVSSLARIARRIGAHKQQVSQQPHSENLVAARELVLIYVYIRPFFFRASDNCLLDSLVLVEFLRHFNVYPTWMIGVSTNPFRAHSWLQMDRVVVSDSTLHVNCYIPILAQ